MNITRMESGCVSIKAAPPKWMEQYDSAIGIKTWGNDNLYPQIVNRLIDNSPTGAECACRFADFIQGNGIPGGDDIMVNQEQSINDLISQLSTDVARLGGCAIHCRYNGLGEIIELRALPLETLRLGEDDDLGYFRKITYCADWSGMKTRNGELINPREDIIDYFRFADNSEVTLIRMADNPECYRGEVLLVSNRIGYPKGRSAYITTPLSTDEGIANTMYRNARTSFNPSGMVTFLQQSESGMEDSDASFRESIASLQGDENTGSMLAVSVASKEDAPQFIPFESANYDGKLTATTAATTETIYSGFKQNVFHLLRIGKIGFGGNVISDAYRLYSLEVRPEQKLITSALKRLAKRMPKLQGVDLTIQPLIYQHDIQMEL